MRFAFSKTAFCPLSEGQAVMLRKLKSTLWKFKDIVIGTIGLCDRIKKDIS